VLVAAVAWGIACSGLPFEIPDMGEPVDESIVVDDLIAAEDPENKLAADARDARAVVLRAFVTATTDFEDWRPLVLDALTGDAATTTEEAYAKAKADFATKDPAVAAVTTDTWKLAVIMTHAYATSEDWAAFSDEVSKALEPDGVVVVNTGPGIEAVSVRKDDKEIASVDLTEHTQPPPKIGYLWVAAGAEPTFQIEAAKAYYAAPPPAEEDGGEEGEEGDDDDAAGPGKTRKGGGKAKGGKGKGAKTGGD
jgi:hypothetical protein